MDHSWHPTQGKTEAGKITLQLRATASSATPTIEINLEATLGPESSSQDHGEEDIRRSQQLMTISVEPLEITSPDLGFHLWLKKEDFPVQEIP